MISYTDLIQKYYENKIYLIQIHKSSMDSNTQFNVIQNKVYKIESQVGRYFGGKEEADFKV